MVSPFSQSTYGVRFEWGVEGLARLAPADVVIVVDVLRFSSVVSERVAAGESPSLVDLLPRSLNGAAVVAAAVYRALRPVVPEVLAASGSGRELADRDERHITAAAALIDADAVAPVLRDGVFVAY